MAHKKWRKNLREGAQVCIFANDNKHETQQTMITIRNYHTMNSLHLLIGGDNLTELPSLGLDIWRSSVCNKHIGGRFSCEVELGLNVSKIV